VVDIIFAAMQQPTPSQLLAAAQQYGTPLYVYHAPTIARQYQALIQAFNSPQVHFFYACKALTNIHILQYIKSLGSKIDCSSINEVKLALHAGFSTKQILYTSNGIHFSEIQEAQQLGVHINIDSLSNLQKFGAIYGNTYPVGIRLRPNIMAGGNLKIATGHAESKFGIPITQLQAVLELVQTHQLNIHCLHIHTGSEIKEVAVFMQGIEVLFNIIHHFPQLKAIDLGGGFKVPYQPNDESTPMEDLGKAVLQAFETHPVAKQLEIWFEPGKFMVSECGYLLSKVNVIKEDEGILFAGIDTGFNHLIRPMFYDAYHRIENISNTHGVQKSYAVTGNICETDTFAWNRPINEIAEGDVLAIFNAGAYGFEMSSQFNSRYKPAEVLMEADGSTRLIRRRDVWEDLLQNQEEV
jgi:diaminopimelate decarboxylase